jgi:hypothetical protein
VGAGLSTIAATQASTSAFLARSISCTLDTNSYGTEIGPFVITLPAVRTRTFALTPPTSLSTGTFTYTSSSTGVATISGNTITIVGAGSTTITAVQASTTDYISNRVAFFLDTVSYLPELQPFVVTLPVNKARTFALTPPISNSTGAFSYTSNNANVATISGNMITIVGAGLSTIAATQASTSAFLARSISCTLDTNSYGTEIGPFVITLPESKIRTFKITTPNSLSTGTFTYTSGTTSVATISGNMITIVSGGVTTITAIQASTTEYISNRVSVSLNTNSYNPIHGPFVLTYPEGRPKTFKLTPPTSTNTIDSFTYESTNTTVATISGDMITLLRPWGCGIGARQTSSTFFSRITYVQLDTTDFRPVFGPFVVTIPEDGRRTFQLTPPTSNSDGTFTYTSSNLSIATISGNMITIVGAGTTTITATQSETPFFFENSVSFLLDTNNYSPVLGPFVVTLPADKTQPFQLIPPTSNSLGTFTYTSNNTAANINGNTITLLQNVTAIITATQAETPFFLSKSTTFNLDTYNYPTIGQFVVSLPQDKRRTFQLTPPTSSNTSPFTYTSGTTTVATISGDMITIVRAGITTITATQDSQTFSYLLDTSSYSPVFGQFVVTLPLSRSITFQLTPPTSTSLGTFTYTSSSTVATISGNMITIAGAGTTTITATQSETSTLFARSTTFLLDTNMYAPMFGSFNVIIPSGRPRTFQLTPPTSNSTGTFMYTSSNTTIATIYGNMITIVGSGSTTITVTQLTTSTFLSKSTTFSLDTTSYNPVFGVFTVNIPSSKPNTFQLSPPTSNSTGSFTYYSSNSTISTISGNMITIVGAGSTTITAIQSETSTHLSRTTTFTLNTLIYGSVLGSFTVPIPNNKSRIFQLTPPTSNSTGSFTYTSSNTNIATINDNILSIVGTGSPTITVTQSGDNFLPTSTTYVLFIPTNIYGTVITNRAEEVSRFFVNMPLNKSRTLEIIPPISKSAGKITYITNGPNVYVKNNMFTVLGAGSTLLFALQMADNQYLYSNLQFTFFGSIYGSFLGQFVINLPANKSRTFQLTPPTSNSDGTFIYYSSDTTIATISGNMITIVGNSSTTIVAYQFETADYVQTSTSFLLNTNSYGSTLGPFRVTFPADKSTTFQLTPPTSNSTGSFTYTSSNTTIATISGNMITIVGNGSTTITAIQSGTIDFITTTTSFPLNTSIYFPTFGQFVVVLPSDKRRTFQLTTPTSNSTGSFTYTSSDTTIATILGNTITIMAAGSTTIRAIQSSAGGFLESSVSFLLDTSIYGPIIGQFVVALPSNNLKMFELSSPVSNSNALFTYTSSNTNIARINNNNIVILNKGITTITAIQTETDGFVKATKSFILNTNNYNSLLLTPVVYSSLSVPSNPIRKRIPITKPVTSSDGAINITCQPTTAADIVEHTRGTFLVMKSIDTPITITSNQQETDVYSSLSLETFLDSSYFSFITDICFPAGTRVLTDQGSYPIESLVHQTIDGKRIVCVTKTITPDSHLICFDKDSLGENMPHERTLITQNHKVLHQGKMVSSMSLLNDNTIYRTPYHDEPLYNVLLEEYSCMNVQGLICETLNPECGIAKLYSTSLIKEQAL